MHSLFALLAAGALLTAGPWVSGGHNAKRAEIAAPVSRMTQKAGISVEGGQPPVLAAEPLMPGPSRQIRIERRVILRIAPAPMPTPENRPVRPQRTVQRRKAGPCVDVRAIGGAALRGDQLALMLRDRRVFVARFVKGCRARDFVHGFYVERSADGMICVRRDRLLSRAGSRCEIDSLHELVSDTGP